MLHVSPPPFRPLSVDLRRRRRRRRLRQAELLLHRLLMVVQLTAGPD